MNRDVERERMFGAYVNKWQVSFESERMHEEKKNAVREINYKREKTKYGKTRTLNYSMLTWLRTTNKVVDKFAYIKERASRWI